MTRPGGHRTDLDAAACPQTPMKPETDAPPSSYRVDRRLHHILMNEVGPNRPNEKTIGRAREPGIGEGLPEPVYPLRAGDKISSRFQDGRMV